MSFDGMGFSSPPRGSSMSSATTASTPPRSFSSPVGGSGRRSSSSTFSDRFIPSRLSTNLEDAFDMLENKNASKDQNMKNDVAHENQIIMNNLLRSELLGQQSSEFSLDSRLAEGLTKSPSRSESGSSSNLFKFRSPQKSTSDNSHDLLSSSSSVVHSPARGLMSSPKKVARKISKTPYKVLDAPSLQDDYYLNLVDWSHANVLSVALGSSVYMWSAHTAKVSRLCELEDDSVTSVSWALSGNQIAVGSNSGKITIYDSTTCKVVREMSGHESRVGTLAWNSSLLASGSRDRKIYCQDIRIRSSGSGGSGGRGSSGSANSSRLSSASGQTSRGDSLSSSATQRVMEFVAQRSSSGSTVGQASDVPSFSIFTDGDEPDSSSSMLARDSFVSGHRGTPGGLFGGYPSALPDFSMLYDTTSSAISPPSLNSTTTAATSAAAPSASPSIVKEFLSHKQEVCGLKWSFDEKMLASGGNDNKLFIWDAQMGRSTDPLCSFEEHTAAVKAVAWSPHQHGLVASGGGTADRHIRFWNANTGVALHKIDTGSQVCNLMWSKNVNEVVSTHGYSLNQVIIWKYPSMQKIATLTGHSLRVLYLAMSPDGSSIVTGAGDETLRFWNVFPGPRSKTGSRLGPSLLSPNGMEIR